MIIELEEGVIFHYNKKEKAIHFVRLDDTDDDFLYSIKGWFGEKLLGFLNSNRDLKEFLPNFVPEEEPREIFNRLLVTLIEQKILAPLEEGEHSILSARPFREEEYADFGTKDFSGSFLITELKEILAYADSPPHRDGTDYASLPDYFVWNQGSDGTNTYTEANVGHSH